MNMCTLDVGCGWEYEGDVNVDLFLHRTIQKRELEQTAYRNYKFRASKVPNFVCADCHYLPFRSNTFETVLCRHLIEHKGVALVEVCQELLRVADSKVVVSVPSVFCTSAKGPFHDKVFTPETFHILFRNFKHQVKYGRRQWQHVNLPLKALRYLAIHFGSRVFCPVPTEIVCKVLLK